MSKDFIALIFHDNTLMVLNFEFWFAIICLGALAWLFHFSRRLHSGWANAILRGGKRSNIYFMRGSRKGEIKMGRAVNVRKRLKTHQTTDPDMQLIASYPETSTFNETILKRRFQRYRIDGEYYPEHILMPIAKRGRI